ncbi:hypothetical protein B0H66DRAFT_564400 [Apodospora peruviana]|uniref:Uncharacterized protein n=1 Tax=Apodospora peruviana TaxID=516989 RepID=A0AAE0M126_9PEZI|nr:hypothetical protein B0H66DRAFT_564400 [Apodospora peruviana]
MISGPFSGSEHLRLAAAITPIHTHQGIIRIKPVLRFSIRTPSLGTTYLSAKMATSNNKPEKLPVAPDFNQAMNRVSMILDMRTKLAKMLNKGRSKIPVSTSTETTSSAEGEEATKTKGFSSLAAAAKSTVTTTNQKQQQPAKDARDLDLNPYLAQPPNAGLGYTPHLPNSGGGGLRGDKDWELRFRMLGGGGKRGAEKGSNLKRVAGRGAVDSESEEDVGRSALGKSKKKKRKVAQVEDSVLGGQDSVATVHREINEAKEAEGQQPQQQEQAASSPHQATLVVQQEEGGTAAAAAEGENKKKRKRNKNNKKKKAGGATTTSTELKGKE